MEEPSMTTRTVALSPGKANKKFIMLAVALGLLLQHPRGKAFPGQLAHVSVPVTSGHSFPLVAVGDASI